MKSCPHCAQDINEAAKVCPYCQRNLEGSSALKWLGILAGAVVVIFVGLLILGSVLPDPPNTAERIEKSCREQFGSQGEAAVNECRLRLSVEVLEKRQQDRLDAARSGAGTN